MIEIKQDVPVGVGDPVSRERVDAVKFVGECPQCDMNSEVVTDAFDRNTGGGWQTFTCWNCTAQFKVMFD